ncbi:MAG: type II toxin-antitoxin system HicB family antitoxin [Actinomycetota bacterium]
MPNLPGCVAAAETREDVIQLIREAMELHVQA